jgi:hypothetical protein
MKLKKELPIVSAEIVRRDSLPLGPFLPTLGHVLTKHRSTEVYYCTDPHLVVTCREGFQHNHLVEQ